MGCFSFICKECNESILSNSFTGQSVELFLLKNGKVVQHMSGEYDSYGSVFKQNTQVQEVKHELMSSEHWNDPFLDESNQNEIENWKKVCDLMFDKDKSNGIAAIHTKCWDKKNPITRSKNDPNQGWGKNFELLSNIDSKMKL